MADGEFEVRVKPEAIGEGDCRAGARLLVAALRGELCEKCIDLHSYLNDSGPARA